MLTRRTFVLAAACALPQAAFAYRMEKFSPSLWDRVKDSDDVVILNFRASWSMTCQIKQELLADALAHNPGYARLTIIDVDWDTYGPSQVVQRLKVERRSTLLVMKGGREVARLVNEPYARRIRALLDTAMTA
ncbi:MAG: thioredoxin family protein [Pseudomonadota bacterium]